MCIFAKHDITKDPPFSNMDLIVCRNLLIYFELKLQEKIIPILHYSLKKDGYLILGQSESIGTYTNLFTPITSKGLIFKRKKAQPKIEFSLESHSPNFSKGMFEQPKKLDSINMLQKEIDGLLLSEYVPASLVLNNDLDVIFIRGDVDPYISIDAGVASLNVTKIVKKAFRPTIQTAIYVAKKEKKEVKEIVRPEKESNRIVNINIKPLKLPEHEDNFYLILFEETKKPSILEISEKISATESEGVKDMQIRELTEELASSKDRLQNVIEQQEATNEELRSSLEEAQSSNEELMSTNEELETTKEELQSTNEELTTLNNELKDRNQRQNELNDDLTNLMNNIDTAVVIIDNDFSIRRFTESAQKLLRLMPSDVDHNITDIRLGIQIDNLEKLLLKATNKLENVREEIKTEKNHWYQLRIRPYLTQDKKVNGAVLSLADITEIKKLEEQVKNKTCQLIEAEGMAAIGKTAGMVGHDIRNPLQAIEGELYLAEREIDDFHGNELRGKIKESIIFIREQLFYINKIIRDLQDFATKTIPSYEDVNVKELVDEVMALLKIPKNIKVSVLVDSKVPKVKADKSYLKRILSNLALNSIQAMPKGGELKIDAIRQDDQAEIKIIDSGVGLTEDAKKNLFVPLFTTKSKGQGFGLAVVKKLTEAMNGSVGFESQEGNGTTFIINLPISKTTD